MMFASSHPTLRRSIYAQPGRSLERFLSDAMMDSRRASPQYKQDESAFFLSLDVPGIGKEHLSIHIEGALVQIKTKDDAPRQYRATYELPQEIEPASSEAKLENGVLTVKLGKKAPESNATEIAIQ